MNSESKALSTILQRMGIATTTPANTDSTTFGQFALPDEFTQFCWALPEADGWPNLPAWRGLISPMGSPSPMADHHRHLHSDNDWPEHLVSFFATDDGDYCFRFQSESVAPDVIYVDHFTTDYRTAAWWTLCESSNDDFTAWLTEFVDWMHAKGMIQF